MSDPITPENPTPIPLGFPVTEYSSETEPRLPEPPQPENTETQPASTAVDSIPLETVSIVMDGATKDIEVKRPKEKAVEAVPPPPPKPKTCEIGQVLPISVIQMLVGAPHNDTVRAVILAHLKQPIPAEYKTYEAIKEWIETTIVFNNPKRLAPRVAFPELHLDFPIKATATEHGRCNYSRELAGEGNVRLRLARFLSLVGTSYNLEDLLRALSDTIDDEWENYINLDEVPGTMRTNEYDMDEDDGHTDRQWDYRAGHRDLIKQLIRTHAPQELERLEADEQET